MVTGYSNKNIGSAWSKVTILTYKISCEIRQRLPVSVAQNLGSYPQAPDKLRPRGSAPIGNTGSNIQELNIASP